MNPKPPTLLPARPRTSQTLMQAQSSPFTNQMLNALQSVKPKTPTDKKKKGAAATALAMLDGQF